jgi:BASS family bile acid:Na+ symporter
MDLHDLILLALHASIALILFAPALSASPEDVTYLVRRPGQLVRSLFAMNVVMPLFAAAVAAASAFDRAIEIALVALAVSPVPPFLPTRELRAGGRASYAIGLLVAAALFAVVFVPLAVELLGWAFGTQHHRVPASTVVRPVVIGVLAPLGAGLLTRYAAPALAGRIAKPVGLVGMILLVVAVLPVFATDWPTILALIGDGTLAALAAFVVVGLAAGHWLGGPDSDDRTVLALSTACRHPGIAIASAAATFPEKKGVLLAVVLLYLPVNIIVSMPYVAWSRRRHAAIEVPTATPRQ